MLSLTLVIVKPGAVSRGHTAAILAEASKVGRIVDLRMWDVSREEAEELYEEHSGKPFFNRLVKHACEDDRNDPPSRCRSVLCVLEAEGPDEDHAAREWRKLLGATDPAEADPATVRGRFGLELPDNAAHGSSSGYAAQREIEIFYSCFNGYC